MPPDIDATGSSSHLAPPGPIGRFAPSPTGGLHLGNARTFLAAWLLARNEDGRMIFRMEDLDAGRARAEAALAAIEDLRWLGLDWDEGPDVGGPHAPYVQSQRHAHYRAALDRLADAELIYPCTCTRADVARMASAPHADDAQPAYPGTCAGRSAADAAALAGCGRGFAWRFRTRGQSVEWFDEIHGPQRHLLDRIGGDFIVARDGDVYSYQLAVTVDDAEMGVSQVVRGDDLLDSTPRQILLQQALGFFQPAYFHLGLVVDSAGKRLAKRDLAVKIGQLRSQAVPAERIVGALARSLGYEVGEVMPHELAKLPKPQDWIEFWKRSGPIAGVISGDRPGAIPDSNGFEPGDDQ